jgi:hypothetical protein
LSCGTDVRRTSSVWPTLYKFFHFFLFKKVLFPLAGDNMLRQRKRPFFLPSLFFFSYIVLEERVWGSSNTYMWRWCKWPASVCGVRREGLWFEVCAKKKKAVLRARNHLWHKHTNKHTGRT